MAGTKILALSTNQEQKSFLSNPQPLVATRKIQSKRAFSLLELFIALALIALVSGSLFLSSRTALEKKRFFSDVARLNFRIEMLQRVSANTQCDWTAHLFRQGKSWIFAAECLDSEARKLPPIRLNSFQLMVDGVEQKEVVFEFFASGEVRPMVPLFLQCGDESKELKVIGREAGDGKKQLGPLHPGMVSTGSASRIGNGKLTLSEPILESLSV